MPAMPALALLPLLPLLRWLSWRLSVLPCRCTPLGLLLLLRLLGRLEKVTALGCDRSGGPGSTTARASVASMPAAVTEAATNAPVSRPATTEADAPHSAGKVHVEGGVES